MGCLKIGGRVIGATDGPSQNWPACYRSANARKRLGCDGSPLNAVEEKKRGLGIDDKREEFSSFLASLGLSTDDVIKACAIAFGDEDDVSDTSAHAADAMFPHGRLARNNGRPATHSEVLRGFGMDRIKHDPYPSSPPGYGDNPNSRSETDAWLKKQFPHAERLK